MTSNSFCLFLVIAILISPSLTILDFEGGVGVQEVRRKLLQRGSTCDDAVPPDASFNCTVYASLGLCDSLEQQYCQQSCDKCVDVSCEDVALPGLPDCSTVLTLNLCQDTRVLGIYCNVSCGVCGGSVPPSPPPTTGSVFTSSIQSPNSSVTPLGDCSQATDLQCDIEALLAFKSNMVRTFSLLLTKNELLSSWNEGDVDPCGWTHVACTQVDGINKRVTLLDLDFDGDILREFTHTAVLVPEFSKLRYISRLVLAGQNVTGTLPKEYSILNGLKDFWMENLLLTGNLPVEYSVWSLLELFVVKETKLTGTLPPQFSSWKFLQAFDASRNALTGTLPPQYMEWQDMDVFQLFANQFSGTLPAQYSTWKNCRGFFIPTNQLSGTLPAEFSVMSVLERFYISGNVFTGSQPAEYSAWKMCDQFVIFDNSFMGTLPQEYSAMQRMENFIVKKNRLTGTLPPQFSEWDTIVNFEVYNNRLSGTLPVEYSKMRFMESFYVQENSFISGTLPVEYSTMKFVKIFAASDTKIQGNIPEEWSLTWSPDVEILI